MRKLLVVLFFSCISFFAFAQNKLFIDKAKLFDLYQNQQYSEAANYLISVYGNDVKDFQVTAQLGYCYLMVGDKAKAEKYYLKANLIQPQNLQVLFSLGSISIGRGNTEEAKKYYEEIVKLDSNNFSAYKQLGGLHPEGLSIQKLKYLEKANRLNPIDADIVFDLSEMYSKMHMLNLVERILKPALQADSNNLRLLKIQLPMFLANSKLDEAIRTGEELFALGDSTAFVLNNLGKVYYLKNEFQKSLDYFKKVSMLSSDDKESLFYNMALCYRGLKDYLPAVSYLKRAIDAGISKNIVIYYTKMGESFEQAGKFESAAATYKKGAFFDDDGNLLYILAQIYDKKLNQKTNAILTYTQVLKSLPNTEGNKPAKDYIIKRIEELKQ